MIMHKRDSIRNVCFCADAGRMPFKGYFLCGYPGLYSFFAGVSYIASSAYPVTNLLSFDNKPICMSLSFNKVEKRTKTFIFTLQMYLNDFSHLYNNIGF